MDELIRSFLTDWRADYAVSECAERELQEALIEAKGAEPRIRKHRSKGVVSSLLISPSLIRNAASAWWVVRVERLVFLVVRVAAPGDDSGWAVRFCSLDRSPGKTPERGDDLNRACLTWAARAGLYQVRASSRREIVKLIRSAIDAERR